MRFKSRNSFSQNGHYLSIDLGLHNLMTCYDSRKWRALSWEESIFPWKDIFSKRNRQSTVCIVCTAVRKEDKISKNMEHISSFTGKQNTVKDYLHKVTRWIAEYCPKKRSFVVVGDIRNIGKKKIWDIRPNQKLHSHTI